jgi:hypothetical protein
VLHSLLNHFSLTNNTKAFDDFNEYLLDPTMEPSVDVNTRKTACMFTFHHQNAGKINI